MTDAGFLPCPFCAHSVEVWDRTFGVVQVIECKHCRTKFLFPWNKDIMEWNRRETQMGLVSFDIVKGNPGALTFLMNAYDLDMFAAEKGFKRMEKAGITGSWLYMLWNDCCNRDTEKAIKAMNEIDIEVIKDHVYRPRGIPFAELKKEE